MNLKVDNRIIINYSELKQCDFYSQLYRNSLIIDHHPVVSTKYRPIVSKKWCYYTDIQVTSLSRLCSVLTLWQKSFMDRYDVYSAGGTVN